MNATAQQQGDIWHIYSGKPVRDTLRRDRSRRREVDPNSS